jgi:flavorubredoxin
MVVAPTAQRLSLQCEAIAADTTTIRSLDWERSRFDIEFGLRNGTTYNSFLVRGERTALIDSSHAKFRDSWIPLLKDQIDPASIDVLIVSHTEPDHSGLIGDLIDLNPEIEIVGSKVAIQFLQDQVHRPFRSRAVKSGEELDLGTNPESGVQHRFEFLSAPTCTGPTRFFPSTTAPASSTPVMPLDFITALRNCSTVIPARSLQTFRFYYDCLMGPNARSVLQALKRMDALPEINTVAVGHGPLLRHHLSHWLNDYREWSGQRSKGESYAAVCYLSQYGFSDRISQAIAHGIGKADAQVQLVDLRATDPQELTALVGDAKAVVVPTWPEEPDADVQAAIGTLLAALHPKQLVGVYDAFGGNDEPIDAVADQLRSQGQKQAFAPLRIRQLPQGSDYQRCEESGTDLGQLLTKEKTIAAMKSLDGDLDKALGPGEWWPLCGDREPGIWRVPAAQRHGGQLGESGQLQSLLA